MNSDKICPEPDCSEVVSTKKVEETFIGGLHASQVIDVCPNCGIVGSEPISYG